MNDENPTVVARRFFDAYGEGDMEAMRSLLAPDAISFITNAEGGVDRVEGQEGFMSRLPELDEAQISTSIAQVVAIDDQQAMTMIEVKAERRGRTLHNFAAFLTRCSGDRVTHLWMVDAKPAYSDDFWSRPSRDPYFLQVGHDQLVKARRIHSAGP